MAAKSTADLAKNVDNEIKWSIEVNDRWWKRFSVAASIVLFLAIASSFVASICTATGCVHNTVVLPIITGASGLVLLIDSSFKLRERSEWHWKMILRYQELERALQRGDVDYPAASRRIDEIEDTGNAEYPLPSMASKQAAKNKAKLD
jgi:hypothetical protein